MSCKSCVECPTTVSGRFYKLCCNCESKGINGDRSVHDIATYVFNKNIGASLNDAFDMKSCISKYEAISSNNLNDIKNRLANRCNGHWSLGPISVTGTIFTQVIYSVDDGRNGISAYKIYSGSNDSVNHQINEKIRQEDEWELGPMTTMMKNDELIILQVLYKRY
jgi:hypothetical protein